MISALYRWLPLLALVLPHTSQAMTLAEALARSVDRDPSVPVSLALSRADREAGQEDRGSLLPLVAGVGDYALEYTKADGVFGQSEEDYSSWSVGVQVRQPLFRLDWRERLRRANALDEQADITSEDRRLQLMARVAQRYIDVLITREDLRAIDAELAAAERAALDTQWRFEAELAPGLDVKEALARVDLVAARRLATEVRFEIAQDALDEVTGDGRAPLPGLARDARFPDLTPAEIDPWLAASAQQNVQLRAARQAAIIARTEQRSTLSLGMPSLDLVARAGRADTSRFSFGQKADEARVGVELTVPLYSGGIASARVRAAEARAEAAAADVTRIHSEVQRETRRRFREVQAAYAEVTALRLAVNSAVAAEAAAKAGYEAGTRTINDLLDSQSRLVEAQRNLTVTHYRLLLNLIELKQLTGDLSPEDFSTIDRLLTAQI